MALPITLSDGDKLEVLRAFDQFRQWRSLDDKRYCLACGKIITGQQIEVTRGTRSDEPLRLSCPTAQCNSIPMDWVLPTDEILARVEAMAAEERKVSVLPPASRANGGLDRSNAARVGIASRLLKFAFASKHSF
jgi:hypothetical protein